MRSRVLTGIILFCAGVAMLCSACSCGGSGGNTGSTPGGTTTVTEYENPIALPQNTSGWTVFSPSGDSRIIYLSESGDDATAETYSAVSSSVGPDPFNPAGSIKPFKTYTEAAKNVRTGYPDWVLFKRGDTFGDIAINPWSGRGSLEFALVSSYGSGALPILTPKSGSSILSRSSNGNSLQYFALTNVDCYDAAHDPDNSAAYESGYSGSGGFSLMTNTGTIRQILLEGVIFRYFTNNVLQLYGDETGSIKELVIRRSSIMNNYNNTGSAHSQGIFAGKVTGLLLEECIFDHGGWYQQADSSAALLGEATMFNHNTYFANCHNITFRNNIFLRSSSMQNKFTANDGAASASNIVLRSNLYVDGEIGIGIGGNVDTPLKFKNICITGNIFTEIGRSQPTNRTLGWGVDLVDWDGGVLQGNYFINNTTATVNNTFAINIDGGTRNATISDNIFYNLNAAGTGTSCPIISIAHRDTKSSIVVANNIIQEPNSYLYIVSLADVSDATGFTFSGNRYSMPSAGANRAFKIAETNSTLATWAALTGDTSQYATTTFADPSRSIASYQASIGGSASIDAFIAACRSQSRVNWDTRYTAQSVNAWLKSGFSH